MCRSVARVAAPVIGVLVCIGGTVAAQGLRASSDADQPESPRAESKRQISIELLGGVGADFGNVLLLAGSANVAKTHATAPILNTGIHVPIMSAKRRLHVAGHILVPRQSTLSVSDGPKSFAAYTRTLVVTGSVGSTLVTRPASVEVYGGIGFARERLFLVARFPVSDEFANGEITEIAHRLVYDGGANLVLPISESLQVVVQVRLEAIRHGPQFSWYQHGDGAFSTSAGLRFRMR